MHIAFISPHFGYVAGGAEVNDMNLGRAFEELGHTVSYFYAQDHRRPRVAPARKVLTLPVHMRYWYGFAERAPGIRGKAMRHLFEHYFLCQLKRQKASALRDQDLILVTGRALLSRVKKVTNAKVLQSVRGASTPLHFRHYDKGDGVIFWGGCEKDHPQWRLDGLDYLTLNAAIEHDIFYSGAPIPELREQLKNRPEAIVVTYTGRLDPIQQVDQIITAVGKLCQDGYPLRLVVVGTGHVEADLKEQAQRELPPEAFLFMGLRTRAEVGDILRASDIFIMNPKHTNHPLALKEALACGIYAVAARTGHIATKLGPDDFARVFTPNHPAEMTEALRQTVVERCFEKDRRKKQLPAEYFNTWQDNAQSILNWYAERRDV